LSDPLYTRYHDEEWGFPVLPGLDPDRRFFEKIVLEGFQAGLSWLTILRKRENFRDAFRGFDIEKMARMTKRDVERLLGNPGIVRHRGKIESAINNARRALDLIDERGSLAAHLRDFLPRETPPRHRTLQSIPSKTPESVALSKDLRKRGWTFVGPTTIYAFMQSVGIVNDHLTTCATFGKVEKARQRWGREITA
jgi:DNA-3-methyladenine glycosylase I